MNLSNLSGSKTYIVVVATIMYALGGMVSGLVPVQVGIPLILGALGFGGLRDGIAKREEETEEEYPEKEPHSED